jgi:hypothetical protein
MIIHGTPLSSEVLRDAGAKDRFFYWRGASGRRYIHSVYPADSHPPLPGAVYVLVRRTGTLRTAIAVGRLSVWSGAAPVDAAAGPCELHVHLMTENEAGAEAVRADLAMALEMPDAAPAGRERQAA